MRFSVITSADGPQVKTISLDASGAVDKKLAIPMSRGAVVTYEGELSDFAKVLVEHEPNRNQALVHGAVTGSEDGDSFKIIPAREYGDGTGHPLYVKARTKQCFEFKGSHLAMLDHDPDEYAPALTPDELISALGAIDPQRNSIGYVVLPSTSAGIVTAEGVPISETNGYHVYFEADHAELLKDYFKALFQKSVIAGHGWMKISRDAKFLIRSCFDASVFSPERIDFVAPPLLESGLTQDRDKPEYIPGNALDCRVKLSVDTDAYTTACDKLRDEATLRQEVVRAKYLETEVPKFIEQTKCSVDEAKYIVSKRCTGLTNADLDAGDLIKFQEHGTVRVADVLRDSEKYDQYSCCDPGEPEYGSSKAKFYANIDTGKPVINSALHGGCRYFLHDTSILGGGLFDGAGGAVEVMTAADVKTINSTTAVAGMPYAGGLFKTGMDALLGPGLPPIKQYVFPLVCAVIARAISGKICADSRWPNVYIMKVGPTSSGKSASSAALTRALFQAGLKDFVGLTDIASGPALMSAMANNNCQLFIHDEATAMFRQNGRNDPLLAAKKDAMLELYSYSGLRYTKQYAAGKDSIVIDAPSLTYLGNATNMIFEEISDDDVTSGMIPRFDFFCYEGKRPYHAAGDKDSGLMDSFIDGLKALMTALPPDADGNLAGMDTTKPVDIGFTSNADAFCLKRSKAVTDKSNATSDDGRGGIISRSYDASIKFAMIHAAGTRDVKDLYDPLTERDISWGAQVADYQVEWKLHILGNRIAVNDFDQDCKMFIEAIKAALKRKNKQRPTWGVLVDRKKKLRGWTNQRRDTVALALVEQGVVEITDAWAKPSYSLIKR